MLRIMTDTHLIFFDVLSHFACFQLNKSSIFLFEILLLVCPSTHFN